MLQYHINIKLFSSTQVNILLKKGLLLRNKRIEKMLCI